MHGNLVAIENIEEVTYVHEYWREEFVGERKRFFVFRHDSLESIDEMLHYLFTHRDTEGRNIVEPLETAENGNKGPLLRKIRFRSKKP